MHCTSLFAVPCYTTVGVPVPLSVCGHPYSQQHSCCIPHKEPRLAAEPDVPGSPTAESRGRMGQDLVLASRAPGEDHIT